MSVCFSSLQNGNSHHVTSGAHRGDHQVVTFTFSFPVWSRPGAPSILGAGLLCVSGLVGVSLWDPSASVSRGWDGMEMTVVLP